MAEDAEKLRKEIDFLSNLIKSHKETKEDSESKSGQTVGRYSWSKEKNERSKAETVTTTTKPSSRKQQRAPTQIDTGNANDKSTGARNLTTNDKISSTSVVLLTANRTQAPIPIIQPHSLDSKPDKSACSGEKKYRFTKTEDEQSHSDSEIYKGGKHLKYGNKGLNSFDQSKSVSTSMSSLSARISELSSSLALASARLKPTLSKVGVKLTTEIKEGPCLIKPSKTVSNAKSMKKPNQNLSTTGSKTVATKPLDRTFYSWNKSNSSQNNNVKNSGKVSLTKLKWTKPGLSLAQNQPSSSALAEGKEWSTKRDIAGPSTSNKKHVWKAKKTAHGSQTKNKRVWRSQNMLKLDHRKSKSPSASSSTSQYTSVKGVFTRRKKIVNKSTPRRSIITRYSVVHSKRKAPILAEKSNKVVVIGGIAYKSSANKLQRARPVIQTPANKSAVMSKGKSRRSSFTLNIRGEKFSVDPSGKTLRRINKGTSLVATKSSVTSAAASSSAGPQSVVKRRSSLKRISIGGAVFTETEPGVLVQTSQQSSRVSASRRSVYNALQYKYKKKTKTKPKAEQYCMYYNRFGQCNKGDKCPYIHDPSKVAVCTKFLRGTCKKTDGTCLFSHKLDREKMPVCQFFLKGTCFNDDCPYSHVNVSNKAAVCEDFLRGYCPLGVQCTKKHTLECEEFTLTGKCSKGRKCKQLHRVKKKPKKRKSVERDATEPVAKKTTPVMTEEEGFLPLVKESAPDETDTTAQDTTIDQQPAEPVMIRPRFLLKKDKEG